jgi:DUF1707 SHOCT-like domain
MDDPSLRVSDEQREHAVLDLRTHLLEGRLTLDEFGERVGEAYRAVTGADLATLRDDLPVPADAPSRRKAARFTFALFAHVVRRGRLRLRRRTFAFSAFADVDLDLRDARIETPVTTVWVIAAFGNVDVYVPEGVDADVGGLTIVGHRNEWGRDVARPDAPAIRVRVLGLFATADVWRVPPGTPGSYREIIAATRRTTNELRSG